LVLRSSRTPEHELALLLAGTAERRAVNDRRLVDLIRTADRSRFAEFAHAQRMAPLFETRIRAAGHGVPPFELVPATARRRQELRALVVGSVNDRIAAALEDAKIPVMPLKGVTLAKRLYGDETMRDSRDVDLLVDASQLADATSIVRGYGYAVDETEAVEFPDLPVLHINLVSEQGRLPPVEVHWRVHWYETRFAAHMLRESSGAGVQRVPPPAEDLAALLLFYHRDGLVGLRLACDIASWWDRYGSHVSAGAIGALARAFPELAPAWTAAALAAERIVGLPGTWLLHSAQPRGLRTRLAAGLANWSLQGDRDQISADVTLIDGLCTPTRQLRAFARRSLLVDFDRLSGYYGVPRGAQTALVLLSIAHPIKLAVRYSLALTALGARVLGRLTRRRANRGRAD
jgi:hypothetical protein